MVLNVSYSQTEWPHCGSQLSIVIDVFIKMHILSLTAGTVGIINHSPCYVVKVTVSVLKLAASLHVVGEAGNNEKNDSRNNKKSNALRFLFFQFYHLYHSFSIFRMINARFDFYDPNYLLKKR